MTADPALSPAAVPASLGHNGGPPMEIAAPAREALVLWMGAHPVVTCQEEANAAGALIDRARRTLADLEADRDAAVRPLNERVKAINASFREPREILERLMAEVDGRAKAWMRAEEERREKAAAEARAKAAEAERIAREALEREEEARADAGVGDCDAPVAEAIAETDARIAEAARLKRDAARAERESPVRMSGGIGRAMGLREKRSLRIVSLGVLLRDLQMTEEVREEFLAGALRLLKKQIAAYRTLNGRLPEGVSESVERI